MKKRSLISIGAAVILTIALLIAFMPTQVSITGGGALSIDTSVAIAAQGGTFGNGDPLPQQIDIAQASSSDFPVRTIYYTDDNGVQQVVDNSWEQGTLPWNWMMLKADYHTRVKEDFTAGQIIEFEVQGETVQFQPMALEWTNDFDQIQPIAMPSDVSCTVGHEQEYIAPEVIDEMGFVRWDDGYGDGIDFEWKCTPGTLEKILEVDDFSSLTAPEQYIIDGGNPVLRLNLIFDHSKGVDIYVDNVKWNENKKVKTFNTIEFRKDGETIWLFDLLQYWSSNESAEDNNGQSVTTLEKRGANLYISIRVPYEWLQAATYPIFVDADITIEAAGSGILHHRAQRSGVFWTSPTVGYIVYENSSEDLKYRKTSDGGATWAAAVNIRTGTLVSYDCWADWQTEGDAGTKIHIIYTDAATGDVRYVYLDTSTDTVGGDDQIEASQGTGISSSSGRTIQFVSITKARGGNLAVVLRYQDSLSVNFYSFYTSPDGDTWTSKTSPWEATSGDKILLFPGNEADNQDLWAIFWDGTANEISLKTFDNSGNSWSEQSIATSMAESNTYVQMDGAIRLSDGHLIFAAWSQYDNAASDLMTWDITDAGTITAKTNIITDEAETFLCSVFINQNTDDIYVAYVSGAAAGSLVKAFYQLSQDGGANWDGEEAMQANVEDDERWISCGAVKATWGGKFQPVWFNDDLNDLFCNTDNGISIAAAAGEADISNTPATWGIGTIATSTDYWSSGSEPTWPLDDGECHFTVTNNGDTCSITVKGTNFTGGVGWTLAGTPAENTVTMKAGQSGDALEANMVVLTTSEQSFISGLAGSATKKWELLLESATSHTDGDEKTGTVTLTATLD